MALDTRKDASKVSAPAARNRRRFAAALVALLGVAASATLLCVRETEPSVEGVRDVSTNLWRGVHSVQASRAFALPTAQAAFSGTVRSAAGGPVAGAHVCAACASCQSVEMPAVACTRTDERGAYALSSRNARAVVISAVAAGYEMGYANGGAPLAAQSEARAQLDIALRPGGATISGTVVDALGGPIPHARVLIERNGQSVRTVHEVRTDDDGHFAFATARGFQTVRAEHDDYAPRSKGVTAPASNIELQLTPASTVRGRVQRRGSGEPIEGVEVRALPEGFPARSAAALSGEDGRFALRGLEPGRYLLAAQSDVWRSGAAPLVEVRLAEVIDEVVVEVAPAVRVLGFVKQAERSGAKPCPRGVVALEPTFAVTERGLLSSAPAGQGSVAPIDVDGLVRFRGVAPGRYDVSVTCPDHVLLHGPTQLDVSDRELTVEWTVAPGLALTVNVEDASGNPVPDLPLVLASEHPERPGVQRFTTIVSDERGRALVRNELTPGKYTVRPAQGVEGEPASVLLKEGSPPAELTLRLSGSGSILVTVSDEAGQPVNGLQVGATPIAGPSDAAPSPGAPAAMSFGRQLLAVEEGGGRYRVGPLTRGEYDVQVEDGVNPKPEARVRVDAGTVPVRVVLPRSGVVRGVVVDQHGDPEANAWVSASPEGDEASAMARQRFMFDPPGRAMTDADGRFELSGLRPGARYTIKAKQPYDNAAVLHDVEPGQTIRIVVPSSASLAGVVLNPQGSPVANAIVKARHGETNTTRSTRTGADGSFSLDRIPAGRVELSAGAMALGHAQRDLELQPGGRIDRQELSLAPPAPQPRAGEHQ